MKYKFGICGPFDFEEKSTGGQSVKTREFYYALCERVGRENIAILESTGYKINPIGFTAKLIKMLKQCEHIITVSYTHLDVYKRQGEVRSEGEVKTIAMGLHTIRQVI